MAKDTTAKAASDPLSEEALGRLQDCRDQKRLKRNDIENCYFYAAPERLRSSSSMSTETKQRDDAKEVQTSLGMEVADDFMTMLIESFMPQSGRWAERLADVAIPKAQRDSINQKARASDEEIFTLIRASNFYAELGKQGVPDAAIGVVALDIRQLKTTGPFRCLAVPIRELEMNLGPDGKIDDRWQIRKTKYRYVKGIVGNSIKLPDEVTKMISDKPNDHVEVRWGYWRLWEKDTDECWQHIVMVGDVKVHDEELKGQGCVALAIGRFGSTPDFAWPSGPMIKSLPDLLTHDEMRAGFIENMAFTIRPPFTYPDDGVINFEDGIEEGMAYPRRPGDGRDVPKALYEHQPLDSAYFEETKLEKRVRRLHYVDFPEQQGKTPPTLGQWLDEMVKAQKRIGTPGYAFWNEFPFEVFQRFKYLAEKAGKIKPIEVGGRTMSLQAYNPAQRAQENQEVLTASRFLQIAGSAFPQFSQAAIDPLETLSNIQGKMGDKLVKIRSKEELAAGVDTAAKLAGVHGPAPSGGVPVTANGQ